MDINILLDKAKRMCSAPTDKAFAEVLGVSPSAVTNYRKGRALPDAVTCAQLSKITGEPLAKVLGMVGEARAISRDEKAVWRRLAQSAALLAVMVGGAAPRAAVASERVTSYALCAVRRLNFMRRPLTQAMG